MIFRSDVDGNNIRWIQDVFTEVKVFGIHVDDSVGDEVAYLFAFVGNVFSRVKPNLALLIGTSFE